MPVDYAIYPPDWRTERRPGILERAAHRCEECHVENYSLVERHYKNGEVRMTKIVLTVAHLDHDPENWDVSDNRLRAWCRRCHLNYDRQECQARRVGRQAASHRFGKNFKKAQLAIGLT